VLVALLMVPGLPAHGSGLLAAPVGPSLSTLLNRQTMDVIKIAVALAGAGLLVWEALARRGERAEAQSRFRGQALLWLGLFAGLCWWDLLQFHFRPYLHRWDTYHYYIGGKYQPEL